MNVTKQGRHIINCTLECVSKSFFNKTDTQNIALFTVSVGHHERHYLLVGPGAPLALKASLRHCATLRSTPSIFACFHTTSSLKRSLQSFGHVAPLPLGLVCEANCHVSSHLYFAYTVMSNGNSSCTYMILNIAETITLKSFLWSYEFVLYILKFTL